MAKNKKHEEDITNNKGKIEEQIIEIETNSGNMAITFNNLGTWSGNKT